MRVIIKFFQHKAIEARIWWAEVCRMQIEREISDLTRAARVIPRQIDLLQDEIREQDVYIINLRITKRQLNSEF